jgi:hypothetical protein
MANIKIAYAASVNLTVTNLNGLAASSTHVSGWESDLIDNTTNLYLDYLVSAKITLESASLAVGEINIWIVPMLDDSTWPGGFDGTESAETTPLDDANGTNSGARLGASVATDMTASQVYYIAPFSVAALFGGVCPAKFVIFITQNTGTTLETSGNQVTIKGSYATSSA